ncbi:hypothetical protein EBZ38_07905 [bacterium]|nr:hypothetical protein [bacterium]
MIDYNKLGLSIYPNFITDEEHNNLIEEIQTELKKNVNSGKYMDRNRVLRYGSTEICHNNYQKNIFPLYIDQISEKLVQRHVVTNKPDAININEYITNDYIAPHVDRRASGPIVTILSLNSSATMLFQKNINNEQFEIELLPKMIIQLRDTIRWLWKHSIYPVKNTRYSIVFRNKNE